MRKWVNVLNCVCGEFSTAGPRPSFSPETRVLRWGLHHPVVVVVVFVVGARDEVPLEALGSKGVRALYRAMVPSLCRGCEGRASPAH